MQQAQHACNVRLFIAREGGNVFLPRRSVYDFIIRLKMMLPERNRPVYVVLDGSECLLHRSRSSAWMAPALSRISETAMRNIGLVIIGRPSPWELDLGVTFLHSAFGVCRCARVLARRARRQRRAVFDSKRLETYIHRTAAHVFVPIPGATAGLYASRPTRPPSSCLSSHSGLSRRRILHSAAR